jgi:hypothetical protein
MRMCPSSMRTTMRISAPAIRLTDIPRCSATTTLFLQRQLPELSRQLEAAYDRALKGLKTTAQWLQRLNPDAAPSLREGMEDTLTVVRLGVPELLRRTLATTNPIESAFSVAENGIAANRGKPPDIACCFAVLRSRE